MSWSFMTHKLDQDLTWELEDAGVQPTTQNKSDYACYCAEAGESDYYNPKHVPVITPKYNIGDNAGREMLGMWCDFETACLYLGYYRTKYSAGKPFPNGRGFYTEAGFHLIWSNPCGQ